MTTIREELVAAAKMKDVKGLDLKAVIAAVAEIDDDAWEKLSPEAQDWFNAAAELLNSGLPIPALGEDPAEPVAVVQRTRKVIPPVEEPIVEEQTDGVPALNIGDDITVLSKRGKTYTGKVVDVDEGFIVLCDGAGVEHDLDRSTLASVSLAKIQAPVVAPVPVKASDLVRKVEKAQKVTAPKVAPAVTTPTATPVTTEMRERIVCNQGMSKAEILKSLADAGITVRPTTLDLVYADTHKVIESLRRNGFLKG